MTTQTLGIDLGTSGVRAVVLGRDRPAQSRSVAITPEARRDPERLWLAVATVLDRMSLGQVGAIAVAGTSGTLLATDRAGAALGRLSLYSDPAEAATVARIGDVAPAGSPARGHTSPAGTGRSTWLRAPVSDGCSTRPTGWPDACAGSLASATRTMR